MSLWNVFSFQVLPLINSISFSLFYSLLNSICYTFEVSIQTFISKSYWNKLQAYPYLYSCTLLRPWNVEKSRIEPAIHKKARLEGSIKTSSTSRWYIFIRDGHVWNPFPIAALSGKHRYQRYIDSPSSDYNSESFVFLFFPIMPNCLFIQSFTS